MDGFMIHVQLFVATRFFDVDRYPRGDFPQIHSGGYLIATECGNEVGKEKLAIVE